MAILWDTWLQLLGLFFPWFLLSLSTPHWLFVSTTAWNPAVFFFPEYPCHSGLWKTQVAWLIICFSFSFAYSWITHMVCRLRNFGKHCTHNEWELVDKGEIKSGRGLKYWKDQNLSWLPGGWVGQRINVILIIQGPCEQSKSIQTRGLARLLANTLKMPS